MLKLFNAIFLVLICFFLVLFGIQTEPILAQSFTTAQSSIPCEQSSSEAPIFRALNTRMKTDSFVVQSPQKILARQGARIEARQDPKLGKIFQPISPTGAVGTTLICRCPAGYSGGCGTNHTSSFAVCQGTCNHSEGGLTTGCRWYAPGLAAPQ
ncbi:hypothetical protein H6F90_02680 [Trichocoleus sp. FACHB-591]|uniref:hypothetical protein n=1 Tax=Trichocoleus sp. FACHB-591 TaxID=2692872 RepID=UPI0016863588|nr:hypothetical protein [Trichocoleus sp. FACHB-591]MBD2094060.1 hypothetical protein [Trichocoleus sp. FACHB-591]